jgi:hypothetical protein
MITFIFGFILGGCCAMLILGLLSLTIQNKRKPVSQNPITEPMKFTYPASYQELRVLSRGSDHVGPIRAEKEAFL